MVNLIEKSKQSDKIKIGIEDEYKKMEKAMQDKKEYAIEDDDFLDEVCKDIMQNIPDVSDYSSLYRYHKNYCGLAITGNNSLRLKFGVM